MRRQRGESAAESEESENAMSREGEEVRGADESLGHFDIEDKDRWLMMGACSGRVIICPVQVGVRKVSCPFFIKGHSVLEDGSVSIEVISLGTTDSKESRTLTSMNRLLSHAHVRNEVPCQTGGNYICHIMQAEVVLGHELKPELLGSSGHKRWSALCLETLGIDVSTQGGVATGVREDDEDDIRPSALRQRREGSKPREERRPIFVDEAAEDDGESGGPEKKKPKRGTERSGGAYEKKEKAARGVSDAVSELRRKLRESMHSDGPKEARSGGLHESKKPGSSTSAAALKKVDAPKNLSLGMEKTGGEIKELLKAGLEEQNVGTSSSRRATSPGQALVAAASQAAGTASAGDTKKKKKKKKDGNLVLKALMTVIKGKKLKKSKKEKKKKKKDKEGPSPPDGSDGSGGSSDEEDEEEESSSESSEDESSEERRARRLQAPLKRRSQKKKGSVIILLLEQISEQLQDLATYKEDLLTSGPKVGTYWQISLKHRYHAGHPALRELYTC